MKHNVREVKKVEIIVRFVGLVIAAFLNVAICSASELVFKEYGVDAPVADLAIQFMSIGAPADSVVLRVSLGNTSGRCCGTSYIMIEELKWPTYTIVLDSELDPTDKYSHNKIFQQRLWKCGTRLDIQLTDKRLRFGLSPFKFGEWISPFEFSVSSEGGLLIVRRVSAGKYEVQISEKN